MKPLFFCLQPTSSLTFSCSPVVTAFWNNSRDSRRNFYSTVVLCPTHIILVKRLFIIRVQSPWRISFQSRVLAYASFDVMRVSFKLVIYGWLCIARPLNGFFLWCSFLRKTLLSSWLNIGHPLGLACRNFILEQISKPFVSVYKLYYFNPLHLARLNMPS